MFAVAMAAGVSGANAAPIALFNTGVDGSGTPRGNNDAETHYTLVTVPSGDIPGLRVATSANGFPIGPWLGDNTVSAWIGPVGDSSLDGPAGSYDYRISFDLTGLVPGTASITGQWSVDDSGTDILINGVSTGNANTNGFQAYTPFSVTSGFVSGINTLDFIVVNGGGPTGLRVEMTGTADPAVVPEPASMALLATSLLGIGLLRRKRG